MMSGSDSGVFGICFFILKGECSMESSKTMESSSAVSMSFVQQMLHNKFLLLTVVLAVFAAVYFCVGLFVLLGH